MEALTFEEMEQVGADYDRRVDESPDVDRFCSSSEWVLPAALALMPPREPWVWKSAHGYLALARARHPGAVVLEPLESMWGLACPVLGSDAWSLARDLWWASATASEREPLILCGLRLGSARFRAIAETLGPGFGIQLGPVTRRYWASLGGGLEGFLGRRSRRLRASLRRGNQQARERGISFSSATVTPQTAQRDFGRLLGVEARSWKGRAGVGIDREPMRSFYAQMLPRLAQRGAARLIFATHGDRDVAYILGGVRGNTYRGLQFSFATGYESSGLGNLCQLEQIAQLAEEGVERYDLGTEVEYKRRWAEGEDETVTLFAFPR